MVYKIFPTILSTSLISHTSNDNANALYITNKSSHQAARDVVHEL